MSESAHAIPTPGTRSPWHRGPDHDKVSLSRIALAIGIIAGMAGLVGAWFVLPYRVDQAEKKLATVEAKMETQQILLIRIDENVKLLRRERTAGGRATVGSPD